jgi:chromosome segregation protein
MLKSLELIGFKSFADRTVFEFSPGVTCVVGPNGSGKSNVVDAIKWVLGEQSPKSLRGKEMADCIFNGSGSRQPINSAEVTLVYDNSQGLLPMDAPEVAITRRVYRSGEGEYLINRQLSRLKDIRELFAGTGATGEAYGIIEQGKVDSLLQSSPKDRREIFEEAAGISRFKAKKVESQRRLERVDQNLLRLADIVEEVENQLRTVRAQAGKARRWRETTERLQELRTQVGMTDFRRMRDELARIESNLEQNRGEVTAAQAAAEAADEQAASLEQQTSEAASRAQKARQRLSDVAQRLASDEATIAADRSRLRDLEDEIARARQQIAELLSQRHTLERQRRQVEQTVEMARAEHQAASSRLSADEAELTEANRTIEAARRTRDQKQISLRERLRQVATLGGQISSLTSQTESIAAARDKAEQRLADQQAARDELEDQLRALRREEESLEQSLQEQSERLAAAQRKLNERRSRQNELQGELGGLKSREAGTLQRIALLEDLERRREGISSGVQDVLKRAKDTASGPFTAVRGMVADLLQVSIEVAPLIEVALGDIAQHVVVTESKSLLTYLRDDPSDLGGRVAFLRLDAPGLVADDDADPDFEGHKGVIGRADRFVDTAGPVADLAEILLGRTWLVESLPHALDLAEKAGPGISIVTLAGELVRGDGTVTIGPRKTSLGLISRRSELRDLQRQTDETSGEISRAETEAQRVSRLIDEDQQDVDRQYAARQKAAEELSTHRQRMGSISGRLGQLEEQRASLEAEMTTLAEQLTATQAALTEAGRDLHAAESQVAVNEQEIASVQGEIDHLEIQRSSHAATVTTAKVQLATSEERLRSLQSQLDAIDHDAQRRQASREQTQARLVATRRRADEVMLAILQRESATAIAYLDKERLTKEAAELTAAQQQMTAERSKALSLANRERQRVRQLEEGLHAQDLAAGELRHKQATLVDRLREDYDIDLTTLQVEDSEEDTSARDQIEEEIDTLRRRLAQLGSVNVEALDELDDLEERFHTLSTQYQDLTKAKSTLEAIINKINVDSRRLFSETVSAVRVHFQELFRKLFGGGQADVQLEASGGDVLDGGVEIVARPPGKELRSISLLSGGEKTLTCVALLLAIFRHRPSPFCVLDEVDAALDEANTERLVGIIQMFTQDTQFIIVSHSKKTMTCADTLYGVTMQESGISKRVSVRFEDVADGGRIRASADEEAA